MVPSALTTKIGQIQKQIRALKGRRERLTESDTIRVLILPLFEALGWDLGDLDELKSEYRHRATDNPVDFALFLQRAPVLFVEAKALNEKLDERKWLLQTLNYANSAGVEWCILTNGDEYRIYNVHAPVEADEKLFLSIRLDDDDSALALTQKISLLSRSRMGNRAIDAMWLQWRVDRQVQYVIESLRDDDSFLRLLAKKLPTLRRGEIKASVRRSAFRVDYPAIGEMLDQSGGGIAKATVSDVDVGIELRGGDMPSEVGRAAREDRRRSTKAGRSNDTPRVRQSRIGTRYLFDRKFLKNGLILSIHGRKGSEAKVIDGKTVEYRGEILSYNEWGCRVTGWSAIQIYKHVILPDGRLLEELRQEAERAQSP